MLTAGENLSLDFKSARFNVEGTAVTSSVVCEVIGQVGF
jgi:hypothetical protein